jgi:hypothetical protein
MSMYKKALQLITLSVACLFAYINVAQEPSVGLGTPITEEQLAEFDLIAGPDGSGFPGGSGTAEQGKTVFETRCAACHAMDGTGTSGNTILVGGNMQSEGAPLKTVGSYWPHASTLFDFIRRAMPANAPKSLTNIEVYQVTAYVLYLNGIIDQYQILNSSSLLDIKMPNRDGFRDLSHIQ